MSGGEALAKAMDVLDLEPVNTRARHVQSYLNRGRAVGSV